MATLYRLSKVSFSVYSTRRWSSKEESIKQYGNAVSAQQSKLSGVLDAHLSTVAMVTERQQCLLLLYRAGCSRTRSKKKSGRVSTCLQLSAPDVIRWSNQRSINSSSSPLLCVDIISEGKKTEENACLSHENHREYSRTSGFSGNAYSLTSLSRFNWFVDELWH